VIGGFVATVWHNPDRINVKTTEYNADVNRPVAFPDLGESGRRVTIIGKAFVHLRNLSGGSIRVQFFCRIQCAAVSCVDIEGRGTSKQIAATASIEGPFRQANGKVVSADPALIP
jgi:hypothetical protein